MSRHTAIAALVAAVLAQSLPAQGPGSTARPDAFVAATRAFSFHSDARLNLHDFLVWHLFSDDPVDPRPDCVAGLPAGQGEALDAAADFYRRTLSDRNPGHDDVMLDLRFHLIGHPGIEIGPDSVVAAAVERLDAALPAYRACWWADHDERNRAWIAALLPRVIAHEDSLAARLARLYAADWELPIPVDVAGYVNWSGANTVINPGHTLLSAERPALRGDAALEILFHEASHTLVHPRRGAVADTIRAASRAAGLDRPPGPFWHVILFYTTGRTVQARLAETGTADYEPYMYAEGVLERAWPAYIEPMRLHWEAYLEGRIGMEAAARRVIEAVSR